MNYETAAKELEQIIAKLEDGNLPLSEAMLLFERGQILSEACYKELDTAKGKLITLKETIGKLTETTEN